jgi:hypothetical protein
MEVGMGVVVVAVDGVVVVVRGDRDRGGVVNGSSEVATEWLMSHSSASSRWLLSENCSLAKPQLSCAAAHLNCG